MRSIGNMIFSLRCEKEISQKKLARGIVSVAELSRIEGGIKDAKGVILEALLQRLGKSMDRLEYMVSNEEYREIYLRETICQALTCEEYELAETLLTEYEICTENDNILCKQFAMQIRAVIYYLKKKDIRQSEVQLKEALELTLHEWEQENLGEVYLCTQEIQILLTIYYIQFLEKTVRFEKMVELVKYIDEHYTEKKEKAKIYPQSAWLAGKVALSEGHLEEAYKLFEAGQKCLAENGVLSLMSRILQDKKYCLKKMGKREMVEEVERKLSAIHFLYEKVQKKKTEEDILFFIFKSYQGEVVISNELLLELREARRMSQEEISEGICAQETLSRIERQKRTPNRKTVREIFEKVDYDRKFVQGYVVSDDYYAYELVGLINENCYKKNTKEAYRLLDELEEVLDLSIPINMQYLGSLKLERNVDEGKINQIQEIEELERLMQYTMKDFNGEIYREPSRQEFVIINSMAIGLKRMGKFDKAEKLYRQVEELYKKSAVEGRNHATSKFLLYVNYVGVLEEENKLSEAEKIGWEGINFMLDCQRGDAAATLLTNIACIYEKLPGKKNKEIEKLCWENSYYLMLLYQHEKDAARIRQYYENKYAFSMD